MPVLSQLEDETTPFQQEVASNEGESTPLSEALWNGLTAKLQSQSAVDDVLNVESIDDVDELAPWSIGSEVAVDQ